MKIIKFSLVLVIELIVAVTTFAQDNCTCVICGVSCNSPASAHTNPDCPVYKNYHSGHGINTSVSTPSLEQEIMLNIFSRALNNLFSSNNNQGEPNSGEKEQARIDEDRKQRALAVLLARQKRYNDSVAQANHNRMMKDYKQLDGSGEIKFKTLDDETRKPAVNFNCKILAYKGSVTVFKPNGKSIVISETQSVELAPGDWIATGNNSRLKLHYAFESGGEDIILGSNSAINIVTNEEGTHVPKLLKGDMYVVNNYIKEKLADNVLDAKDELTNDANRVLASVRKKMTKMEVQTPSAVCAVRGTEFTVNVDEFENTIVNVKKGNIALTGNLIQGTIMLSAGTRGIVKASGEILGPLQIDDKQQDYWSQDW